MQNIIEKLHDSIIQEALVLTVERTFKELKYDQSYLEIARVVSQLSHDPKTKVGCIIVKNGQILSQGWNGMPAGMPNKTRDINGKTRKEVIHAEANALSKLACNGGGAYEATLYSSHSPCFGCALQIHQAKIKRVVHSEIYCEEAIDFLKERGLQIDCLDLSNGIFSTENIADQYK